ncbi:MAG: IclR family transcriptional regulator [Hyphomonadaceae bacterium]|nr:IclR family transcriptional regulator [Hyphomonadaceae bacterium]
MTDLAHKLDMTLPTVSRHLSTWRELGFVDRPEGEETYRLGTELFTLGHAAAEQYVHVSIAYPFLTELRDQVRETVVLATRFYDKALSIVCVDSSKPLTLTVRPGTVLQMPYSPTARVLWAFSEGALQKLDTVTSELEFDPALSLTKSGFKKKIEGALKNWYDFDMDVRMSGLGAIAAPIFDHTNDAISCVTVLMPATDLKAPDDHEIVQKLKQCAASISSALGSSAWRQNADVF